MAQETAQSTEQPPNTIKNTFGPPGCTNEYFTPETLFGLVRAGFSYKKLPPEAQKMVDSILEGVRKRDAERRSQPGYVDERLERRKRLAAKGMFDLKAGHPINPEAWKREYGITIDPKTGGLVD